MKCPYCQNMLAREALFCAQCKRPYPHYISPEGFMLDERNGMYYRYFIDPDKRRRVMWFNPATGQYKEDTPPPTDSAEFAPPEGFAWDEKGGRYFRRADGYDEQGLPAVWTTYFDPLTGQYTQDCQPLQPEPSMNDVPAASSAPGSDQALIEETWPEAPADVKPSMTDPQEHVAEPTGDILSSETQADLTPSVHKYDPEQAVAPDVPAEALAKDEASASEILTGGDSAEPCTTTEKDAFVPETLDAASRSTPEIAAPATDISAGLSAQNDESVTDAAAVFTPETLPDTPAVEPFAVPEKPQTPSQDAPIPGGNAPEGFALHEPSGLYYRTDAEHTENGFETTQVTWYDPVTGEYAQVEYTCKAGIASVKKPPKRQANGAVVAVVITMALLLLTVAGVAAYAVYTGRFFPVPAVESNGEAPVLSESSPAPSEPSEPPISAEPIVWKERLVEETVRVYLNKPDGGIMPSELTDIRTLAFVGSHSAVNQPLEALTTGIGPIGSLNDFAHFPALEELTLDYQSLPSLSSLPELPVLEVLSLRGNSLSDIRPLAGHISLTTLLLSDNRISDVSPLTDLVYITTLSLEHNRISDIAPLEALIYLEQLYLSDNRVSNVTPLARLKHLETLTLDDNPVLDLTPVEHVPNLLAPPPRLERGDDLAAYLGNLGESEGFEQYIALFGITLEEYAQAADMDYTKPFSVEQALEQALAFYPLPDLPACYVAFGDPGTFESQAENQLMAVQVSIKAAMGRESISVEELRELYGPDLYEYTFRSEITGADEFYLYIEEYGYYILFLAESTEDDNIRSVLIQPDRSELTE